MCVCVHRSSSALLHGHVSLWVHPHTHILCGQGKTLRAQLPLQYPADSSPFFIAFLLLFLSFSLPRLLRIPRFSLGDSLAAAGYHKRVFFLPSLSLNQPLTLSCYFPLVQLKPPFVYFLCQQHVPHLLIYYYSSLLSLFSLNCLALLGHESRTMRNNRATTTI